MDINAKFGHIENIAAFEQEAAAVQTPQELKDLLARYSISLTDDELRQLAADSTFARDCELSEEDLDNVAGGAFLPAVIKVAKVVLLVAKRVITGRYFF